MAIVSFDLEKLQAVAELGEVIRLQNEALDKLVAFRRARPYLMMPNLAKMVEENIKENVQVLYKELNNLHKPAEERTRYICEDCKMAFLVRLPGGICDECRARRASKPRDYVVHAQPLDMNESEVVEESAASLEGEDTLATESLAEEAANEVAEDLTVAPPMPVETVTGEVDMQPETERAEENGYALSLEGDDDLSFDSLRAMADEDDEEEEQEEKGS